MSQHHPTAESEYNNAVFTQDKFKVEFPDNEEIPGGWELFLALSEVLKNDEQVTDSHRPGKHHHEHGYWYLRFAFQGQPYLMYIHPITDRRWRLQLSANPGCLSLMLSFKPPDTDGLPTSLQTTIQRNVEKLTDSNDFQWVSDDDVDTFY